MALFKVESNGIQFRNFIIFDQATTGIETKTIKYHENVDSIYRDVFYNETHGSGVMDSIIIGNSNRTADASFGYSGLIVAWDRGQVIKNLRFINFPDESSYAIGATKLPGKCE